MYYTFWVRVSSQHAKHMRRVILSSVACPALLYISTLSTLFWGKKLQNIKWVFWFSLLLLSDKFFILRRIQRNIIIHTYISLHVKYTFLLVRFLWYLNSLDMFSNSALISNFIKIHPVGAEMFHPEWRTDRHYVTNCLCSQFCESP